MSTLLHTTVCQPEAIAYVLPYRPKNPYQPNLVKALAARGVASASCEWPAQTKVGHFEKTNLQRILHLHWLPSYEKGKRKRLLAYLRQLMVARFSGLRIVWTAHNLWPHESEWLLADKLVSRFIASLSHSIIAHSESAKGELVRETKVKEEKITVIPHGNYIDSYPNTISSAEARARLGVAPEATHYLFFGQLRAYKGIPELIEAFGNLKTNDAVLTIAGKPHRPEVDAQLRPLLGNHPRIRYRPGFVPDEDLQVLFNAADVVVFPYENILTSGAVVLAMSFGKACIVPRIECLTEYLDPAGAFIFDRQSSSLKDAMAEARHRQDQLAAMGRHNLRKAENWSWDRIASATKSVYLGRRGSVASEHQLDRVLASR